MNPSDLILNNEQTYRNNVINILYLNNGTKRRLIMKYHLLALQLLLNDVMTQRLSIVQNSEFILNYDCRQAQVFIGFNFFFFFWSFNKYHFKYEKIIHRLSNLRVTILFLFFRNYFIFKVFLHFQRLFFFLHFQSIFMYFDKFLNFN